MEWNQYSTKRRLLLFSLVSLPALLIVLLYFRIIPWTAPKRCRAVFCDPYHWQILVIGIAFFCAGLALIIPASWRKVTSINAVILVVCFVAGVIGSLFFV